MATVQPSSSKKARSSSTTTKRKAPSRSKTNALNIIKADHQEVKAMFAEFEKADEKAQIAIAERICLALKVHAKVEEELLYPMVREEAEAEDLVNEAVVEHTTAKQLIAEIERGKNADPLFEAKVSVLGEYVNHHVKEEESQMFAAIRKADVDLEQLGEKIMARKDELMKKMAM